MKNRKCNLWASALLASALTAVQCGAQSTYVPYAFTNFAGGPGLPGSNDGIGSVARFMNPGSVAVDDAGNVYVTDFGNHTIRKITPGGAVTTLAGLAGRTGSTDGAGSAARFNGPATLDVDDNGNIYVTDYYNHTIRKVTPAGVVTTLAGSAGHPGAEDGSTSDARFNHPIGVAVDSAGNVYVGDFGNHTIRKITPAGEVMTLAGSAGVFGFEDGPGIQARFNGPHHVRVDAAGNIYVADTGNNAIRKISPEGAVTTLAGAARFHEPFGVAVNSNGTVYVADTFGQTIRKISPAGTATTLAGLEGHVGNLDGAGSAAGFNEPISVAIDGAGNLYVADYLNHRITKGTPLLQFETDTIGIWGSIGMFHARLTGPSGRNVVLEVSPNLQAWTPLGTNALSPDGFDAWMPMLSNENWFLRARLVP